MNKIVDVVHEDLGRAQVYESSLKVWLARGWKMVDAGAEVEQTKVSGEGPAVEVPSATRTITSLDLGHSTVSVDPLAEDSPPA